MPIPPFDGIINALPPHLGEPHKFPNRMSPYRSTAEELVRRFATSPQRRQILEGYLNFRAELYSLGLAGFQWIGGSFLENVEVMTRVNKPQYPGDIDVVSWVLNPKTPMTTDEIDQHIQAANPKLVDRDHVKATFKVDSIIVALTTSSPLLMGNTRYWYGLFSHTRESVWKGMLVIDQSDPKDDQAAWAILKGTSSASTLAGAPGAFP